MNAVTHLEKVITGEVSAVTHLEKVIAGETSAVTYTEKVITGEATPITHLQKVIAGEASPVTHLEYVWVGGTPSPTEHEYTGAVPYTFTANGSPLISWSIYGNTVQNGTPTPQTPIQPQETGERTGNLVEDYIANCNIWTDGVLTSDASFNMFVAKIVQGQEYSLDAPLVCGFFTSKPSIGSTSYNNSRDTSGVYKFVAPIDGYVAFRKSLTETTAMLNTGNTALPYEPYGIKIPISSASTTTPIYLGEVETTRRIKKLVLTGEETVAGSAITGGWIVTQLSDSINNTVGLQTAYCSHFAAKNNGAMSSLSQNEMCISTQYNNRINFVTTFATSEDFKAYLAAQYAAGTPVTVWYVLANEETGIVNEPLMRIGDYADEVSNVATIPTNNGRTTIDVLTELKPSEVYIKYKGV